MSISIYLKYKIHQFIDSGSSVLQQYRHLKGWWHLYAALTIVTFALGYITESFEWYKLGVLSLSMFVIVSIYKDYKSGAHMYWYRRRYLEKGKQDSNRK